MSVVRFQYLNWRGIDHEYLIVVEGFEIVRKHPHYPDAASEAPPRVVMHGHVVMRDGDPRRNMGHTRRRTFVVTGLRNLEVIL